MPVVDEISQPQNADLVARIAPSPTGFMHLGNARTAMLAWLSARSGHGKVILRIEDIDTQRVVTGATEALQEDLASLGLDWDLGPGSLNETGPFVQSQRIALYDAALHELACDGLTFGCACSRADLARLASAPHEGEEGPRYPGTCRTKLAEVVAQEAARAGKQPAIRFKGSQQVAFVDGLQGTQTQLVDDFVLRRADGLHAYQLAVVVDDAAMGVTQVVRGDDLLSSTGRQIALHQALGFVPPKFIHVPLVLSPSGERLAKRSRPETMRELLSRGVDAQALVGALAASAGLCKPGLRMTARDLVAGFSWSKVTRSPVVIDPVTLESYPA
jgi:glutamyl-tRNA synthetase